MACGWKDIRKVKSDAISFLAFSSLKWTSVGHRVVDATVPILSTLSIVQKEIQTNKYQRFSEFPRITLKKERLGGDVFSFFSFRSDLNECVCVFV